MIIYVGALMKDTGVVDLFYDTDDGTVSIHEKVQQVVSNQMELDVLQARFFMSATKWGSDFGLILGDGIAHAYPIGVGDMVCLRYSLYARYIGNISTLTLELQFVDKILGLYDITGAVPFANKDYNNSMFNLNMFGILPWYCLMYKGVLSYVLRHTKAAIIFNDNNYKITDFYNVKLRG